MNSNDRQAGLSESATTDDAIVDAVKRYMQLLDQGTAPPIELYISQFPDLAHELRPALEGLAMVYQPMPARSVDGENDTLGLPPGQQTADRDVLGKPIGDFQIVREIGRGGMGVVYEAVQLSLNRNVALKVLPFASGLDKVRLQRFRNEAHAAAQLHHTNIVPVYAVGSERGVHYYAMQLIEGHTLAELLAQMKQSQADQGTVAPPGESAARQSRMNGSTNRSRPLDETFREASSQLLKSHSGDNRYFESIVEMTIQAAAALEHAHRYGVVHRDVKPGNLLLDQTGKVWVTDFGLAQIQHADSQLTRSGDQIGTLRYMSPEQSVGDRGVIDHRTDIYSLGITLYELLTLQPAIEGDNYRQMLNQIAEREPINPRQINPSIPVDLETIVRKAIAKDPLQRYSTAQALADDLDRWLHHQPIAAKPPTAWQRLAKWRKRNSLLVNMLAGLLAVISCGLLITTLLVWREQHATQLALDREIQQRNLAESNFEQAREAVDTFSELSESELAFRPEAQTLRKKILEISLNFYRSFLVQSADDKDVSQELQLASQKVEAILTQLKLIKDSGLYFLLADPRVCEDLKVDESTGQRMQETVVAFQYSQSDPLNLVDLQYASNDAAIDRMQDFVDIMSSQLTENQTQRLKQISLQLGLPFSILGDDVAEQLKLSTDQRQQINAVIKKHGRDLRRPDDRRGPGGGPPPNGLPPFGGGPGSLQFQPGSFEGEPPGAFAPPPRDDDPVFRDRNRHGPKEQGGAFRGRDDHNLDRIRRETVLEIYRDVFSVDQRTTWDELVGVEFRM